MKESVNNPGLSELGELCIQIIRFLFVDAIQKVKSNHLDMHLYFSVGRNSGGNNRKA